MNTPLICSMLIVLVICLTLNYLLKNRTLQVEKFTNSSIIYTANRKDLK